MIKFRFVTVNPLDRQSIMFIGNGIPEAIFDTVPIKSCLLSGNSRLFHDIYNGIGRCTIVFGAEQTLMRLWFVVKNYRQLSLNQTRGTAKLVSDSSEIVFCSTQKNSSSTISETNWNACPSFRMLQQLNWRDDRESTKGPCRDMFQHLMFMSVVTVGRYITSLTWETVKNFNKKFTLIYFLVDNSCPLYLPAVFLHPTVFHEWSSVWVIFRLSIFLSRLLVNVRTHGKSR